MANTLLTTAQITRKALALFLNSNSFLMGIDRQYDSEFARTGAKIGSTLRIRLPNDYTLRLGPTAVAQNTTELSTPLVIGTQMGVDVSFSSVDRALSLDDFGDRILQPMMNTLAGGVAVAVMSMAEGIPSIVHAVDGSNNTVSPTANTFLQAGAVLDLNLAPRGNRQLIVDPMTQARAVSTFSTLFNNQEKVGRQYSKGVIGTDVLGYDWRVDQSVLKHVTGAYGTMATVNGAGQTGNAITISALNGPLVAGDIVTFAGVFGVNHVIKSSNGTLQQFAVTAAAAAGATSISIYPALTPVSAGAYATVTASPANGAAVASPVNASETYRKNIAFVPQAFTMVTADLDLPRGVHEAHRETYDGVSLRMITGYNVTSDQFLTRLDILFGYALVRPEWACIVADVV